MTSSRELIQTALAARGYVAEDGHPGWICWATARDNPTRLSDSQTRVYVAVQGRTLRAGRSFNHAKQLSAALRTTLEREGETLIASTPINREAECNADELGL